MKNKKNDTLDLYTATCKAFDQMNSEAPQGIELIATLCVEYSNKVRKNAFYTFGTKFVNELEGMTWVDLCISFQDFVACNGAFEYEINDIYIELRSMDNTFYKVYR